MQVFSHHIYEYTKGLRRLILHTTKRENESTIRNRLTKSGISHVIYGNGPRKINVFFGDQSCVDVVRTIGKSDLRRYTDEEDFMLGALLGYDIRVQCARYLSRRSKSEGLERQPIQLLARTG